MSIYDQPPITDARKLELIERFDEPEENYNLLREGSQSQKQTESVLDQKDTNVILQDYLEYTDKIIGVADGSIGERDVIDPRDPERSAEKPDVMIFLDKSARPVADLMSALWEQFAADGAKMPDVDFLNIDRVNWFTNQGYSRVQAETVLGPADFDIDKVSSGEIAAIRALFVRGDLTEGGWQDEVMNMPTILDGKNVTIIDEVKSQGGTLSIATQLLRRAIPEAIVTGHYFWETNYKQMADGKLKADSVPVWYDKENPMGRGVGEVSKTYYETLYEQEPTQENLRRKIGWFALSAPHHTIDDDTGEISYVGDSKYTKLKQDIAYLTYANTPRIPSKSRTFEDMDKILESQGITGREALVLKDSKRLKYRMNNDPTMSKKRAA